MSQKAQFTWAALIGSIIGGYIPSLWGADFLSLSGLVMSTVGGIIGIAIFYKLTTNF